MLSRLAILGTALVLSAAVPTTTSAAKRAEYFVCMAQAEQGCYPLDSNGNPRPPDLNNPEEEAVYRACYVAAAELCTGLPGDPNG